MFSTILLRLCGLTILVCAFVAQAQSFSRDLTILEAALDEALDEVRPDFEARLLLAQHVRQVVASTPDAPVSLDDKAQMVEAVAHMRLADFDKSRLIVEELCAGPDRSLPLELWVRCRSLNAILMMVRGERVESLAAFEALLAEPLEGLRERVLDRVRISYAAVLSENGKIDEALDLYEKLMVRAIAREEDELALIAGNNLTVNWITQQHFDAAEKTLAQLMPILSRNPDSIVAGSLQLHDLELARVGGDLDRAIAGLRKFIAERTDPTPLMLGSAYRLLADALRDSGQLSEAYEQGSMALDMLKSQNHEAADARITLAKILIRQQKYAQAIDQLDQIDPTRERVPARQVVIYRLRLEAILRSSGSERGIAALEDALAADRQRDLAVSTARGKYFDAQLTTAKRGLELEKAEAMAMAQLAQNETQRRNARTLLGLVIAIAAATCVVIFLLVNRRAEKRRLREKQQQNERLEVLVEDRTRELKATLNKQSEMAHALERTKRNEAIGLLAGNVAHDFNNLLQVIVISNETLANDQISDLHKTEALEQSDRALAHATSIIRQLLAYTRQQDLSARPVKFGQYLSDSIALLKSALGERNELVVNDRSNEATLNVDTAKLTTSILNLISNSADALPKGGRVILQASPRTLSAAEAAEWNDLGPGTYLSITVTDNGVGMSESEVARATEPFFTTKDSHAGTGLGLSSVYGFVKQSGGDLKINSELNFGTTVELLLPMSTQIVATRPSEDRVSSVELENKRLLLVDDNDHVADMLEATLQQLKLSIVRVNSGEAAKGVLVEDSAFDYVLSDVRMPGSIDGPALAQWIRTELPDIRVLLMSGFSDVGLDDVDAPLIRKPFSTTQLTRFMRENAPIS